MKNIEALERIEQAKGAKIEKLIWIAGSFESSELTDLLSELDDDRWKKLFPEIFESQFFEEARSDIEWMKDSLLDFKKLGLIAEINIPTCDCFSYTNGKPTSWCSHPGICRIEYIYAESLEDLMSEIEKVAEKLFQEYVRADKKKLKKKVQ